MNRDHMEDTMTTIQTEQVRADALERGDLLIVVTVNGADRAAREVFAVEPEPNAGRIKVVLSDPDQHSRTIYVLPNLLLARRA